MTQCRAYLDHDEGRARCRRQNGHPVGPASSGNSLHISDPLDHPVTMWHWLDEANGAGYLTPGQT